ncbi:uncharacterized protein A1O9_04008 [Exophiala aquamarina CBS 119918]|uniref:Uncharacterized protein n=1 Tax=Exophiala aquamarina CBS 119918 TaxID=1182545 RepID=A0A072PG95_9EURO|nr:uncharacterized protein A1O9_04008 [Exophiala aquamarina CBS 119918]KEF59164.1 hypothetical protein A1O9_04008 [Exophiala aquamarina CBS 119918]
MHLGSMRDFKIGSSLLWSCTAPARSRLLLPENSFCSATINAVAEKTRLDYTKLAVDSAKDATDTLKKELDVTSSAFQKAASDFPDGWDLIGQQIVAGLADTFNQVVSKAVPLLMASMSPMGKLDFLTGELGETATGLRSAIEGNGSTSNSDPKNNNMAPRPRQHPTTPGTPFMTDPAYSQVNKDITFFEMLQVLLTSGKEGGVNWEKAKGDVNNARSSAGFLKSMLNHSKESFSKLATTSETSSTYHGILNDMAKVTENFSRNKESMMLTSLDYYRAK